MFDNPQIVVIAAFAGGVVLGSVITALIFRGRNLERSRLIDTFKALAADTLHQNSAVFLQLAEGKLEKKSVAIDEMVKPVKETLQRMDEQLRALEIKREGAYRELAEMVSASRETQLQLRKETGQLLQALRAPTGRGRWGELQLQRILEMTGMSTHARDFVLQGTVVGTDGSIKPDVIVALPGNHSIIIDSKVPLAAYLDAVQSSDETERQKALKLHARQVKDHIKRLGNKAYWEQIEGAPEFVVLFLPGEHFLSAALDGEPDLMEYSAEQQVVIATPMTLIALLRAVAYGWRQETLSKNMQQIAEMGRKLHGALITFAEHLETLGNKLSGAVVSYNNAIGSLERNVLSKARQLASLGTVGKEENLPYLDSIEQQPRTSPITEIKRDANENSML